MTKKEYVRCYLREYRATHKQTANKTKRLWCKKNPEFRIFCGIKQRCNNPKTERFAYYGGRGIKCDFRTWRDFLLEVGRRPSPNHSVDRINNDGHYAVGNVRWATSKEQAGNRRRHVN